MKILNFKEEINMSKKRMFSNEIIDTDRFLELPLSTQCLYFHLGMKADDDGFVANPKKVIRWSGCSNEDLEKLRENGYIHIFESGVVVIIDWLVNNTIRCDRYSPTRYLEEKSRITVSESKAYRISRN